MKIKRMVKRLFAVGTGVAMIGATAMGAVAAADLKDYPNFLVKDGVFDGYVVVGEKAAAVDNLAATDIATSMMAPKAVKAADAKATTKTTVTGDAWSVGTSSKKYEIANSNASSSNIGGESIKDINTFIGSDELKALADGSWSTNEQAYPYHQYLFFDGDGYSPSVGLSSIVKYDRNDEDNTDADYFSIASGKQIARYRMEFTTTAHSDDTDSTGAADTTGTYLDDFKNTDLTIFGKPYTVVLARRPDTVPDQSVKLTLMAGAVHDTLLEGETKSYTVGAKPYEVTLAYVDDDEAKFIVNGEATNKLKVGDTYVLKDKSEVGASEILYQSYAGGVHSATFFVGAQKMELRDDQITDSAGAYNVKIGSEDIDGTTVIVAGTDNNSTLSISTIDINMTAQDNYFVGAGKKLSDAILARGDEQQVLFTNSWDVEYKGLTDEKTHDIRLAQSSVKRYHLHLFDGDNKEVELPVAYAEGSYNLSVGEESFTNSRANQKRLHVTEGASGSQKLGSPAVAADGAIVADNAIWKDDYFVVTGGTASDGSAKSYLLQYKGSDKQTKSSPKIKFKNAGSGETLEYSVSGVGAGATATVATIKIGGYSFIVQNASSAEADDFAVIAALSGGSTVSNGTIVNFVDSYGSQWAFAGATHANSTASLDQEYVTLTQTTPNGDDYDNEIPSNIVANITITTDPEVRAAVTGVTTKTPDGKSEIAYAYTSMGTLVTLKSPSSDPQELDMSYPEKQKLPQLYFTAGAVSSSTSAAAGDMALVTIVDATKLDSEIADVKAQNLLVVGGPCVNSVAAALLNNPTKCDDGFTPGKARIKLFDNAGKVAMLVAGYSGADTRLAGKVVAHRAKELSGMEVEVEGTTFSDATISAPTKVTVAAPATTVAKP